MVFNAANHKAILLRLLKAIAEHPTLGPLLGFKGGTAAYLIYGLPRDSVDLDFDLLDLARAGEVYAEMRQLLRHHGAIKEEKKFPDGQFFLLAYNERTEGTRNVKIDISTRPLHSTYEIVSFVGLTMNVMVREDMAANKMLAMHNRIGHANRDIFDVWYFLEQAWPINEKIVEARSEMVYNEFLRVCIKDLESMNDNKILDGIGELLSRSQKDWARAKLRTETISLLTILLESRK